MTRTRALPGLSLKERLFRRYLTYLSRPSVVRREALAFAPRSRPREAVGPGKVRVAAVQMEIFYDGGVTGYVERISLPFRQAVNQGAALVVYPEYVTLPLLGLLPGVGPEAARPSEDGAENGSSPRPGGSAQETRRPALAGVVRFMEPVLRNIYFTLFSTLAREAEVYIVAGSTPLPDPDGHVYNASYLFGPDGRVVGAGRKLHLFPRERHEGLHPGTELEVFQTGVGRLSLPVCMDATYFETYRLAALLGAEIVAAPIADVDPGGYNPWKHLRGAWPRVQESPVYAVQSALVGSFMGRLAAGKASVFGPLELSPGGDGVLAQCAEPVGSGLAAADLDLEALASYRNRHPVFSRLNLEVVRNYIPQVYERFARRRRARPRTTAGETGLG